MIIFILLIAAILRFYDLQNLMPFIGDQAWFYLSARDMMLEGNIPLLGITSSHTWLHQGPYWTYMLAGSLWLFGYEPVIGGYLSAGIGVLTVYVVFKVAEKMFSKDIAYVSAILYAVFPLVIIHARMPYHTSPIPLLILILLFSLYKLIIENKKNYVPGVFSALFVLYNFQLSTQVLWLSVFVLFFIGIVKREKWVSYVKDKKLIALSILTSFFFMLPIILYDIQNGFKQTILFAVWFPYKIFTLLGNIFTGNMIEGTSYLSTLQFLGHYYKMLVFPSFISGSFLLSLLLLLYFIQVIRKYYSSYVSDSEIILLVLFVIPLIGIMFMNVSSEAYLPVFFPLIALLTSLSLFRLIKRKTVVFFVVIFITIINTYYVVTHVSTTMVYGPTLEARKAVVASVIEEAGESDYTVTMGGPGSQFESSTMNFEYLAWIMGKPPVVNANLTFFIKERGKEIVVKKRTVDR